MKKADWKSERIEINGFTGYRGRGLFLKLDAVEFIVVAQNMEDVRAVADMLYQTEIDESGILPVVLGPDRETHALENLTQKP